MDAALGAPLVEEVNAVEASWLAFSVHALVCGQCRPQRTKSLHPGAQSHQLDPLWGECCEAGRDRFGEWRHRVAVLRQVRSAAA